MTLAAMLERNSIPEPNSGCWIWLRGTRGNGYPAWTWQGRQWPVSHLALATKGITVPHGRDACHHCDVPLCVNPEHLFVGTRTDNMQDAKRKGRIKGPPISLVCPHGHEMSGTNLHVDATTGKRRCNRCLELRWRERDAKRKAERHARGLKRRDARWGKT